VPVSSDYAALAETVQFGTKLAMDEWNAETQEAYKNALIDMLLDTEKQDRIRKKMMPVIREKNSWSAVATSWIKAFES
jgi:glycosyltransferase involved in cell wall biosynthesis